MFNYFPQKLMQEQKQWDQLTTPWISAKEIAKARNSLSHNFRCTLRCTFQRTFSNAEINQGKRSAESAWAT